MVELLVVIAIISVISGLVIPGVIEARRRAEIVNCASNLKQIYTFALAYSDQAGNGSYPFGKSKGAGAHESLNELLSLEAEALEPEVFVCPASTAPRAERQRDGTFELDADTLGFAWVAQRTRSSASRRPLACCKYVDGWRDEDGEHTGHRGGVNVLYTDGSIRFVPVAELDQETLLASGLTR